MRVTACAVLKQADEAEREEIFRLTHRSYISDQTSRKLGRVIDLVEAPYR